MQHNSDEYTTDNTASLNCSIPTGENTDESTDENTPPLDCSIATDQSTDQNTVSVKSVSLNRTIVTENTPDSDTYGSDASHCACVQSFQLCCKRVGCNCKESDTERLPAISHERQCTDVPCLLIFGVFTAVLCGYVWISAFLKGNPYKLINGVDYRGRICGKDSGVDDKPYAFWPAPQESFRFKVCTDDCMTATYTNATENSVTPQPYRTESYLGRYCVPLPNSDVTIKGWNSYANQFTLQIGDVEAALPLIYASFALALIFAIIYIKLIDNCVGCFVWSAPFIIFLGIILAGYITFQQGTSNDSNTLTYLSFAIWIISILFLCFIIYARKRIQMAIAVIECASQAVDAMSFLVMFPILPLLIMAAFIVAWFFATLYILSSADHKYINTPSALINHTFAAEESDNIVDNTYSVLDYNSAMYSMVPHLFFFVWVIQIAIFFTFTVIAGAVADWYFRTPTEKKNLNWPIKQSCRRVCRFHMGTVFFAAILVADIQILRSIIRYLERLLNGGHDPNRFQELLFKLLVCLLWWLECCLDKLSSNGLIFTAIYGDAFCPAMKGSFNLLWDNLMRVAAISFFSTIITALGKAFVPIMTASFCGVTLIFMPPFNETVGVPMLPIIIIFILSAAVGYIFIVVYDTAIDTVLLCFLIDAESLVSGRRRGLFADDKLQNIVKTYESHSEKRAQTMKRESVMAIRQSIITQRQSAMIQPFEPMIGLTEENEVSGHIQ